MKKILNRLLIILSIIATVTFFVRSCFNNEIIIIINVVLFLILIAYLVIYLKNSKKKIKNEKVSILSLHLGYGGIEQANINLANILCKKYEVELVSLYKTVDIIPYKLDLKVKLIYLSELKPNKKELMEAYRNKKVIKFLLEGFKSIKILFCKKYLVAKYIVNCDSKYIISSRIEFTKQLNYYGNKEAIKVAQEHCHHNNNKKYIMKLKKALLNIDYLLPVSKELADYYAEKFKDINTLKVLYIRHALYYYPKNVSKNDNKIILSIGRLSANKGFDDLIEVFKEINKADKEITFVIVGSGEEENKLKQQISKNRLTKKVIFTGFLNKNKLHEYYSRASIFLLGSRSEAFGLVLIEAMAFGIPCLAFDSAQGAKEIINCKNGVLIEKRNIKKMAEEAILLLNNKEKYKLMSENARKKSAEYQINKVRKEWYNLLERN